MQKICPFSYCSLCSFSKGRKFRPGVRKFRTPSREKSQKDLAKKAQMKIWAGYSGATAGTSGGRNFWTPGRNFRTSGRNFRPSEKLQNEQYENGHIFCIRTPFSMILGSLDSQRKALQDHAEKHHCPSFEKEIIRREFDLSKNYTPGKPPILKTGNAVSFAIEVRKR